MKIEETLSRWQAEEDAVRARVPIGDTLGFVPIRIEHGLAIFQGRPQGKYYTPPRQHSRRMIRCAPQLRRSNRIRNA